MAEFPKDLPRGLDKGNGSWHPNPMFNSLSASLKIKIRVAEMYERRAEDAEPAERELFLRTADEKRAEVEEALS